MIKAKVVTFKLSRMNGSLSKLELETYLEDQVDINSFCMGIDSDGKMDAVIMNEEEYKALDWVSDVLRKSLLYEREKTEKPEEEVEKLKGENDELAVNNNKIRHDRSTINSDNSRLNRDNSRLRGIVKEQSETIQKLEEENQSIKDDIRDLKEKMAQKADEVDIRPGGTIIFRKKRVSELEKEVERLKEENKTLKNKDDENKLEICDEFSLNITDGLFYKED